MNPTDQTNQHWSGTGKLRGGRPGVWLLVNTTRLVGPRAGYLLAALAAFYFSFTSPDIAATINFHRRAFGPQPWWKRRWLVFRHFYSFGRAIIDRIAIHAGLTKNYVFQFDGDKNLRAAVAGGRGVLLLTAHLGNWEAAGQLLMRVDVPITITGFDRETPAVRALLESAPQKKFKLLPLTGGPTDAIPLVAALRRGEVVAMLGDRAYGSPTVRVPFFGGTAALPIGAYVMASIAGSAVMHVFSHREPGGRYRFFGFEAYHPQLPSHQERDAYLKSCATKYARDMESILQLDPLQWYNFFPFWEEEKITAAAATPSHHSEHSSELSARPSLTK